MGGRNTPEWTAAAPIKSRPFSPFATRTSLLINWPAWANALHIITPVVVFALVIIAIDLVIRLARRRRTIQ